MAKAPQLPDFNDMELEVIFLTVIWDMIDGMVNNDMLRILGEDPNKEVRFQTSAHSTYFNILLVDFLSPQFINKKTPHDNYLDCLKAICAAPQFEMDKRIVPLTNVTAEFQAWLTTNVQFEKIWFPTIGLEADFKMTMHELLKICGNIAKHNFTRLTGCGRDFCDILERNNVKIDQMQALMIFEEFWEQFHDDVFHYHSSTICEFLNNIRIAIWTYLLGQQRKTFVSTPTKEIPTLYRYDEPVEIKDEYVQHLYWRLMDKAKHGPYIQEFKVTPMLKKRYQPEVAKAKP
ncbi:MAG: hypothetical protein IPK59_07755 [Rhodospirillaceae bacterium]|nr:hypothetical protein [Rhodospirillaceae bacterium]